MSNLAQTKSNYQIDVLSNGYLNGEFDGSTGGDPNPRLWIQDFQYREGYCKGVADFYNKKFGLA